VSTLEPARAAASIPALRDEPRTQTHAHAGLGFGLIALGFGLAVNSLIGPFVTGAFDFHVTETLLNQMIGLDAISLVVVAPLSVAAGGLALRGHVAGPALALGVGPYTAYMFVQYTLGPDYLGLPGNSQLLFPLYLALFTLGWIVSLMAWCTLDVARLPRSQRRDRLVGRVVLPVLGFLAFFRYVPALADAMSSNPENRGYLAGPTFFWAIALMDLGVFLPATIAACVGLVRGTTWAHKALYTSVGWFALVGPAVAGMAIAMYADDDPNASAASVASMTALGLVFALLAAFLYRPLFRRIAT
jgi:hypothetical protein